MKNKRKGTVRSTIPFGGVFIFSKIIKNDGVIRSEGKQAITKIESEKYSGEGKVLAEFPHGSNGNWHQNWWGTIIIGITATVIGGIILSLIL